MRIDPDAINNPKIEVLFHETTKNFEKMPIQYRVCVETISWSCSVQSRTQSLLTFLGRMLDENEGLWKGLVLITYCIVLYCIVLYCISDNQSGRFRRACAVRS